MILFCGIPSEPPLRLAVEAARAAGTPHLVFNQREAHFCDFSFDIAGGRARGALHHRGADYPLENFSGV
ncbi:MAG TPA: hypothetical protein VK421_15560, partial [Pyrinomonadaceae bacterium]|nr:hypothetical protein [Pyrinomonadaceae bacterium]